MGPGKLSWNDKARHGSANVKVSYALSPNKVYEPFLCVEQSTIGTAYSDMMELWFIPQLEADRGNTFFSHKDGEPPHFHRNVTQFLKNRLPRSVVS